MTIWLFRANGGVSPVHGAPLLRGNWILRVTKLRLTGYRSYDVLDFSPHSGLNVIFGANAAGKTNILEAIFLSALGRSHRTAHDAELIGHSLSGAYVGVELEGLSGRRNIEIKLRCGERKQIFIDRLKAERIGELMGVLNVVMFSPEDLELVKAAPERRRRFMDMELCQLRPAYFFRLQKYNLALRQRSALIKESFPNRPNPELLDMWNEQLARLGGEIMRDRAGFIGELGRIASDIHARISSGAERLDVAYSPNVDFDADDAQQRLYYALDASIGEDLRRGYTTRGPHRDDIMLKLGGSDVRIYGSQGQQRTAALSVKLSELTLIKQIKGEPPVLLLDDVLSELDRARQRALLSSAFDCQCFLTATSLEGLEGLEGLRAFECRAGRLEPR